MQSISFKSTEGRRRECKNFMNQVEGRKKKQRKKIVNGKKHYHSRNKSKYVSNHNRC